MMKYFGSVLVLIVLSMAVQSQPPEKHRGVLLFEQGNYQQAIPVLEASLKDKAVKGNAELWNYLGLAQLRIKDSKRARKALQQAVKLSPDNAIYRANLAFAYFADGERNKARSEADRAISFDSKSTMAYNVRGFSRLFENDLDGAEDDAARIIELEPTSVDGYKLKSDVMLARLAKKVNGGAEIKGELVFLNDAILILDNGIAKTAGRDGNALLVDERDSLTAYIARFTKPQPAGPVAILPPEPGVTPYRILSKPIARYTDDARRAGTQGKIRIVLILGADGRVRHPMVLQRLGNGLDENALSAAKRIIFEPKKKNGKPVPVVVTLEYNFNIY